MNPFCVWLLTADWPANCVTPSRPPVTEASVVMDVPKSKSICWFAAEPPSKLKRFALGKRNPFLSARLSVLSALTGPRNLSSMSREPDSVNQSRPKRTCSFSPLSVGPVKSSPRTVPLYSQIFSPIFRKKSVIECGEPRESNRVTEVENELLGERQPEIYGTTTLAEIENSDAVLVIGSQIRHGDGFVRTHLKVAFGHQAHDVTAP